MPRERTTGIVIATKAGMTTTAAETIGIMNEILNDAIIKTDEELATTMIEMTIHASSTIITTTATTTAAMIDEAMWTMHRKTC